MSHFTEQAIKIPFPPICALALLSSTLIGFAVHPPETPSLPNLDKRREENAPKAQAAEAVRGAAWTNLNARIAGVSIAIDDVTGSPKFIFNRDGFLSHPDSLKELEPKTVEELQKAQAQPEGPRDPHQAIKRFLDENKELFGHDASALAQARLTRNYVTEHNGMRTVVWEQQLDGIPVFEAVFIGHITQKGELISLSSQFLPDVEKAAGLDAAERAASKAALPISARLAVAYAAVNIEESLDVQAVKALDVQDGAGAQQRQRFTAPSLLNEAEAQLVWLPVSRNSLRLCWQVWLKGKARQELYKVLIDAQTGEVLVRHLQTLYAQSVTFNVFTSDSPSPFSPGHAVPATTQPAQVSRNLVEMLNVYSPIASPNGWIPDGGNTTVGNNVDAHLDWGNIQPTYNQAVVPARPSGSPFRVFDKALDLNQSPTTYGDAAVVQLFYWCNWMHDRLFELGFTEAAGNFQNDNYGRGGLGGDAVLADAQDSANLTARNNANFQDVPDGDLGALKSRIQMYLWDGPAPDRDGDMDTEIILHEYTHGLSTRLVGHGTGISASESMAMGEGWSDFYALALLSESGDAVNGNHAMGGYVVYKFIPSLFGFDFLENYYFGIRRYPYSTDMTKNPLRFKDYDYTQWGIVHPNTPYPNVPITPLYAGGFPTAGDLHSIGEIWCVTLWEARANLINKYGFSAGNQLILQLVTDGMKLSPPNPTFLQARDAILLADRVKTGGANLNELWAAFAKRGMGYSAYKLKYNSVFEAFDVPPQSQQKWAFTAGNEIYSSPAIGVDGTIYIGSDDGKIYALDPVDGHQIWAYTESMPSPQSFRAAPIVAPDGTIYARRSSGHLYAINPNGTLKWRVTISYDSYVSPALGRDGTIYIAGYTSLYAFSPQGILLWTYATGNTIYSSPAIAPDGTIYFGGMDAKLHAVNPVTGLSKAAPWPLTLGGSIASSPAIGPDGTIYVGSYDKKLYAIRQDGTFKWPAIDLGGKVDAAPAIGPDGSVYVGSWTQNVCCGTPIQSYFYSVNPNTGQVNPGWPYTGTSGSFFRSSPAVAADGTVYVGSYDGKLHAFTASGATKPGGWPFSAWGSVFSSPAIDRDGTVYFGTVGSKVHAVKGVSGLAKSSWPMFRRDPRHFSHSALVQLHSGVRWPGSAFQFSISAGPELSFVELHTSSDLINWTPVVGNYVFLPGGTTNYLDGLAAQPQRFYRVFGVSNYRSFNPYGYVTRSATAGWSMMANPLNATNNSVRALFNGVPDGTSIYKINEFTAAEEQAIFSSGVWSGPNFTIFPGEGVKIYNPTTSPFPVTFVGEVLQGYLVNPIPAGSSRRSSMVPQAGGLTTLLAYPPGAGDQYQLLSASGVLNIFSTYSGTQWTPSQPSPGFAEAFGIINASTAKNWTRLFSVWPPGP